MLLESYMPNFNEVDRLESCQKSGELWLEGERRKKTIHLQPITAKIQSGIKSEVSRITRRSDRNFICYSSFCL